MFAVLGGVYVSLSGAPIRVHALSLGCLAIAFWLPAVIADNPRGLRARAIQSGVLILVGMLVWDGLAGSVITNGQAFAIIRGSPWAYAVGFVTLAALVCMSAALAPAMRSLTSRIAAQTGSR